MTADAIPFPALRNVIHDESTNPARKMPKKKEERAKPAKRSQRSVFEDQDDVTKPRRSPRQTTLPFASGLKSARSESNMNQPGPKMTGKAKSSTAKDKNANTVMTLVEDLGEGTSKAKSAPRGVTDFVRPDLDLQKCGNDTDSEAEGKLIGL